MKPQTITEIRTERFPDRHVYMCSGLRYTSLLSTLPQLQNPPLHNSASMFFLLYLTTQYLITIAYIQMDEYHEQCRSRKAARHILDSLLCLHYSSGAEANHE